jgi:DNA-binding SARP family transcriptional activator
MRLLVQAGRRHLALRHYQALRTALQRELEVEPDASLQALYQDVRDGRAAHGARSGLIRVVEEPAVRQTR